MCNLYSFVKKMSILEVGHVAQWILTPAFLLACKVHIEMSSGYSQSALLLAHNQITAPQFIRRSLHSMSST